MEIYQCKWLGSYTLVTPKYDCFRTEIRFRKHYSNNFTSRRHGKCCAANSIMGKRQPIHLPQGKIHTMRHYESWDSKGCCQEELCCLLVAYQTLNHPLWSSLNFSKTLALGASDYLRGRWNSRLENQFILLEHNSFLHSRNNDEKIWKTSKYGQNPVSYTRNEWYTSKSK